jgi:hypothetical protein
LEELHSFLLEVLVLHLMPLEVQFWRALSDPELLEGDPHELTRQYALTSTSFNGAWAVDDRASVDVEIDVFKGYLRCQL